MFLWSGHLQLTNEEVNRHLLSVRLGWDFELVWVTSKHPMPRIRGSNWRQAGRLRLHIPVCSRLFGQNCFLRQADEFSSRDNGWRYVVQLELDQYKSTQELLLLVVVRGNNFNFIIQHRQREERRPVWWREGDGIRPVCLRQIQRTVDNDDILIDWYFIAYSFWIYWWINKK